MSSVFRSKRSSRAINRCHTISMSLVQKKQQNWLQNDWPQALKTKLGKSDSFSCEQIVQMPALHFDGLNMQQMLQTMNKVCQLQRNAHVDRQNAKQMNQKWQLNANINTQNDLIMQAQPMMIKKEADSISKLLQNSFNYYPFRINEQIDHQES